MCESDNIMAGIEQKIGGVMILHVCTYMYVNCEEQHRLIVASGERNVIMLLFHFQTVGNIHSFPIVRGLIVKGIKI